MEIVNYQRTTGKVLPAVVLARHKRKNKVLLYVPKSNTSNGCLIMAYFKGDYYEAYPDAYINCVEDTDTNDDFLLCLITIQSKVDEERTQTAKLLESIKSKLTPEELSLIQTIDNKSLL